VDFDEVKVPRAERELSLKAKPEEACFPNFEPQHQVQVHYLFYGLMSKEMGPSRRSNAYIRGYMHVYRHLVLLPNSEYNRSYVTVIDCKVHLVNTLASHVSLTSITGRRIHEYTTRVYSTHENHQPIPRCYVAMMTILYGRDLRVGKTKVRPPPNDGIPVDHYGTMLELWMARFFGQIPSFRKEIQV